jgi:hypothetical protein
MLMHVIVRRVEVCQHAQAVAAADTAACTLLSLTLKLRSQSRRSSHFDSFMFIKHLLQAISSLHVACSLLLDNNIASGPRGISQSLTTAILLATCQAYQLCMLVRGNRCGAGPFLAGMAAAPTATPAVAEQPAEGRTQATTDDFSCNICLEILVEPVVGGCAGAAIRNTHIVPIAVGHYAQPVP